jgi:hypothetical protein
MDWEAEPRARDGPMPLVCDCDAGFGLWRHAGCGLRAAAPTKGKTAGRRDAAVAPMSHVPVAPGRKTRKCVLYRCAQGLATVLRAAVKGLIEALICQARAGAGREGS